jgi:heat shock protein HslJ
MRAHFAAALLAFAALGPAGCAPATSTTRPAGAASGVAAAAPDGSRTSLDWPGRYTGVVPCADCEGIETTLVLRDDERFALTTRYLGTQDAGRTLEGSFAWDDAGRTIALAAVSGGPSRYLVGENRLFQLDLEGRRITGPLADRYVLHRAGDATDLVPEALVAPARWRLVEVMGKPVAAASDPEQRPWLAFERDGGRVHGFAGCNTFAGSFEHRAGSRLRFAPLAVTQRACAEMASETELLRLLASVDGYALVGRTLSLHRARMAPLARFEAVYPR